MTKTSESDIIDIVKNYEISLKVNANPVALSGFPKDFLIRVLLGAASSLKGVREINQLELTLRFGKVKILINQAPIALVPFPTLIIARTLSAIVSTLKDVDETINNIEVNMESK